jgi:uncharacterized protein (TIGR02284 family)
LYPVAIADRAAGFNVPARAEQTQFPAVLVAGGSHQRSPMGSQSDTTGFDMDKSDIIDNLNDLIQITEDSHDGYSRSAEDAKDPDIKALFTDLSAQRESMVRELQNLVRQQGGEPKDSGTILAGAHRFFVDLKSAVTGKDRDSIIKEVERGESEAIRRYENVLSKGLPADVSSVVSRLLDRFRSDRNRMASLKRA